MNEPVAPQSANARYCQMEVTCPRCGGRALVPWARLGKVLRCSACAAWCRLDRFGKPYEASAPTGFWVQVRSSFASWERVRVLLGAPEDVGIFEAVKANWRFSVAGALVALACIAGVGFATTRSPAPAPTVAEPQQPPELLEGRVGFWARAWLADDTSKLLMLVEPTRDRHLRRWLSKHRPPPRDDDAQLARFRIEVAAMPRSQPHLADVKLTIVLEEGDQPRKTQQFEQLWHQRDGAWYFWPQF
jgi:hypothetical protein